MPHTALILSASAGAGHVRAAQALERAFALARPEVEVRHLDTLDYTNKLFRRLYAKAYLDLVASAPTLLGWFYDRLDEPYKNEKLRLALNKLNAHPFRKLLRDYQPDLAICTHFLPAEIISRLKAKGELSCPLAVVVTDLDVHAMWLTREADLYFVALDETREHLCRLGVPAERIHVTGIPIDPVFAQAHDRRTMRAKHGLVEERTTILVSAGGFGVGPIEHLFTSLLQVRHPVQLVVICGRNEELKAKLSRLLPRESGAGPRVHLIGFTTEMHEYMAAADLIVGKPGGLTTSEALAQGLAMVIVNPIPGQEERNSDHLLEEGVAVRCNNLPALAWKIDRLLADPRRLATLRDNAGRLAKPHAARAIVQALATHWREPRSEIRS